MEIVVPDLEVVTERRMNSISNRGALPVRETTCNLQLAAGICPTLYVPKLSWSRQSLTTSK